MPQDSLRSAVYRSFVTCDDPKGIVECGTIRKSKTGSKKMEHKIETQKPPKNSSTSSSAYKEEIKETVSMGGINDWHKPSSFQLQEVSRGAQNLNRMTDSWSKGVSLDGKSKDIAKDLLRGALDLQESLIMLGKLQEASQYMAKLKKKQKEKSEGGRAEEVGNIGGVSSNRFGDQNYLMGFQNPRLSVDGSSRNSVEDLKRVIRDSLARKNLLPNATTEELAHYDQRKPDTASEIPSSSSSQSSMVHSYNSGSTDSSLFSATPQKKAKGPNLIARLLGLEEFSPRPLLTAPQKQLESERFSNQRKPIFDIDMPKARKPQFVVQKVDPEQRTLKEILETMQFKGLLKSDFVPPTHHSSASHSRQRLIDDIPPIVLIKPLHFPCREAEEPLAPKFIWKEEDLDTKEMFRKLKVKEEPPPTTMDHEKRVSDSSEKLEAEAGETPIKRLSQKGDKNSKMVVRKADEKEVKTKEKASNKAKASVPVNHSLKKEVIDKKAEKIQKATPTGKKPVLEENVKPKKLSKHQDAKVTSTKPRKPEDKSNDAKNQLPGQQSTIPNTISKRTAQTIIPNSTDQKTNRIKKEKPVREPSAANLVTKNLGFKDDDRRINLSCENLSAPIRTNTTLADQLPAEEETDASEIKIEESCSNGQSSLNGVPSLTTQHVIGTKSVREDCIGHNKTERKSFKTRTNLHYLLLSSAVFISHAEELFDLNVNHQPIIFKPSGFNDFGEANVRLSLDCANEFIQRKILQESQLVHPLLKTRVGNSKSCISLDHLVEEICDGIENFRRYSKLAGENLLKDSIYAMLERDLKYKEVVTGIWDLSWKDGFSVDEVDQVVAGIEKLVFGGLLEEVFTDFVL